MHGEDKTNEASVSTHEALRAVFDAMEARIFVVDLDFTLTDMNGGMLEVCDLPDNESVIGRKCFNIIHGRDEPCPDCIVATVYRTGAPASCLTGASDSALAGGRTFKVFAYPLTDETGSLMGAVKISKDITAHKQAKEARQASEAQYRDLVETSQDLIWKCDGEGRFTYLNPAWQHTLGYALDEMLGRRFTEFKPPDMADTDARMRDKTLQGADVFGYETVYLTKSGRRRDLMFNARALRDADGNLVGTQGTAHDITDRKRAEEERVLLERQVQHAQKLESLGVLAGGIAHDFNNLLMAILGNADMALMDMSEHSPARPCLNEIKKATKRAAELTNQMLAYSGKGHFVVEPLDLNSLVEEMSHLLGATISKKAVLANALAPQLPLVDADAAQVRQVLMNLITNASDSLGDGNGLISVTTRVVQATPHQLSLDRTGEDLPEGQYVCLSVSDTGCGMDGETISRLFDPFFSTKFTGRGLGLSAVLGIVRGHRGGIMVESELGKGTTFKVLLPCSEATRAPARKTNDVADDGQWQGSGTVLLVDDEQSVRDVASRMLARAGMRVLTAADGAEAVEIFRQHADEIAVVLLDMTMPKMDGEEASRALRQIREDTPIILASGYTEEDATGHFAANGLAGFIQKPYLFDTLIGKLRGVLERV